MYGSALGNVLGTAYLAAYQLLGLLFARRALWRERRATRIVIGSAIGSAAMMWLPALFAMFMGFTVRAHIFALSAALLLTCSAFAFKPEGAPGPNPHRHWPAAAVILCAFAVFAYMLYTHTLPERGGALYTGQATYGDMNMHLSFITSIARQGDFPPDYSILPGTRLSYPFLCDSVSSSVYIFGASLKWAYCLPLLVAVSQLFVGFYILAYRLTKRPGTALLAWLLFFVNGGFGFFYFTDKVLADPSQFSAIFTGFYNTPTSLGDMNMRWAQTIVNMLLPQRATLMGWALLFPLLLLLFTARKRRPLGYFALVGVMAGALPMIHTHSFVACALICAGWMFSDFYASAHTRAELAERNRWGGYIVPLGIALMSALCFYDALRSSVDPLTPWLLALGVGAFIAVLALSARAARERLDIIKRWGLLLIVVLVLALPQMCYWTFSQASGEGFIRAAFNWSNEGDTYLYFYIKNIGVAALLAIPALICAKRGEFLDALPALLIWFAAELIGFQPNIYDNNKLLFVAYALLTCLAAGYAMRLYDRLKSRPLRLTLTAIVLFFMTFSAVLTIAREVVSEYELYDSSQVALAEYVEANTAPDDTILTDTRHNNAVASLTGRNIVCGSGSFLGWHGLDYSLQEAAARAMYESPDESLALFDLYSVDYVLVSWYERSSYPALDEAALSGLFTLVYEEADVRLYKVADE